MKTAMPPKPVQTVEHVRDDWRKIKTTAHENDMCLPFSMNRKMGKAIERIQTEWREYRQRRALVAKPSRRAGIVRRRTK